VADFATTHWSVVIAAGTEDLGRRQAALAQLCEGYWMPLYAFIRRRGHAPDVAADLTQGFFAHIVEKDALAKVDPALGRFRAFLLASVKHFVANERDRELASKRGGRWTRLSFDATELERRYEAVTSHELDPEQVFDRQWAATVIERALARLRADQVEAGKQREFDLLAGYLTSDATEARPYRELAAILGAKETAVRAAVHRLRLKFGAALRAEIADTVRDQAAADAELRHVLTVGAA
jgi:RNA polymerase sigma-70 factor (ECF subfamily)